MRPRRSGSRAGKWPTTRAASTRCRATYCSPARAGKESNTPSRSGRAPCPANRPQCGPKASRRLSRLCTKLSETQTDRDEVIESAFQDPIDNERVKGGHQTAETGSEYTLQHRRRRGVPRPHVPFSQSATAPRINNFTTPAVHVAANTPRNHSATNQRICEPRPLRCLSSPGGALGIRGWSVVGNFAFLNLAAEHPIGQAAVPHDDR